MSAVGLQTERLVLGQADRPDTTTLQTLAMRPSFASCAQP